MINYGLIASDIDGSEHIYSAPKTLSIPEEYSYKGVLPKVLDQGYDPICVPCSLSAYLNWRENIKNGTVKKDNGINLYQIYNSRTTDAEGMSFKDALYFLRHEGVKSDNGKLSINEYAMVLNIMALRMALIANGPCIGGLPVRNDTDTFWIKEEEGSYYGSHAISIVGYNKDGFIIRNSWGRSFGKDGYTFIKNEDFGTFREIWTIIS